MNTFQFQIISPDGTIFHDEIDEVSVPTTQGEITILPHHIPLFSKLTEGEIKIKKGNHTTFVAFIGGFLEVNKTQTAVISDYAIKADSIELARAQEAKERAQAALKEKVEKEDIITAQKEFGRAMMELKVADKMRKRRVQ